MQTFSDRVAAKATEMIDEEVARVMQIVKVAHPSVIVDYAQYRYIAGQIHGLEVAKEFLSEAATAVQQEVAPASVKLPTLRGMADGWV